MKNRFYSVKEKVAFRIFGYCDFMKYGTIVESLTTLNELLQTFANEVSVDVNKVKFDIIDNSCRYKNMICLYVEIESCPENYMELKNDWTRTKWTYN